MDTDEHINPWAAPYRPDTKPPIIDWRELRQTSHDALHRRVASTLEQSGVLAPEGSTPSAFTIIQPIITIFNHKLTPKSRKGKHSQMKKINFVLLFCYIMPTLAIIASVPYLVEQTTNVCLLMVPFCGIFMHFVLMRFVENALKDINAKY